MRQLHAELGQPLPALAGGLSAQRVPIAAEALDVARAHVRSGNVERAVTAVWVGCRGKREVSREPASVLADCVRARPAVWLRAARAGTSGGTLGERLHAFAAVVEARLRSS